MHVDRLLDDVFELDRFVCYQRVKVDPPDPVVSVKLDGVFEHVHLVPDPCTLEVDFEVIGVFVRVRELV